MERKIKNTNIFLDENILEDIKDVIIDRGFYHENCSFNIPLSFRYNINRRESQYFMHRHGKFTRNFINEFNLFLDDLAGGDETSKSEEIDGNLVLACFSDERNWFDIKIVSDDYTRSFSVLKDDIEAFADEIFNFMAENDKIIEAINGKKMS